ncbi:MAG TPA: D-aminoacyl-tRNA deacylase [Candidatus Cybelea sp.]|jgi:D-tyrosyl-tRNA(Tyr) deacylase|nr:D-aminoacyl-tRNA deacylase [Candidatus Cybelea sp.]
MRAVVQRVARARVRVGDTTTGEIGKGMLALVSVGTDDDDSDARAMAEKLAGLRIFPDDDGRMNRSVLDAGGALLLVSQFTLHGDARHGRRPSFIAAAKEPQARRLFEMTGAAIRATGLPVAYGEFGAEMEVELVNSGPVTVLLDTKHLF